MGPGGAKVALFIVHQSNLRQGDRRGRPTSNSILSLRIGTVEQQRRPLSVGAFTGASFLVLSLPPLAGPARSSLPIMPSIQLVGHLIPFDIDSAPERLGKERERGLGGRGAGSHRRQIVCLFSSLPSL